MGILEHENHFTGSLDTPPLAARYCVVLDSDF